jgi:DNA-binding MarR family transcriptional regulator
MSSPNIKTQSSPQSSNPAQLLDNQLCFSLYSASLAMTKLYKPLLEALDLTYPQYLVMLVLWERDDLSVSALGDRLSLDSGTLTPLLKRMETAGLLVRQRSSEDERRVHVCLSPAGQQLQVQAAHIPGCVVAQSGLPLSDLFALNQQIKTLRTAMHAPAPQPNPLPPRSKPEHSPKKATP